MATYSKELAQNWINKYNNSEAKAEGISFEDFLMDCMMDYGHNEEAAVAACESDGKYLVVLQNRRTFKTTLCVRTFNGGDWIFSCKNEVCYWMPIPKTPIE